MILADKIIKLRKKNGWSQEELADKVEVSRQAVSKWESATAIPSLEKILQLSELFGVTADYLLKDDIEVEEFTADEGSQGVKKVSLEEANAYISERKKAANKIAIATFLCILSPITLIILGAATEVPNSGVSETFAGVIGLVALFILVLCAVPMFIYCGFKNAPYEFLDKSQPFELEYGVRGIVKEKIKAFSGTYAICNIIATCLCIFSPVPLVISAFTEDTMLICSMLGVTMVFAGIGASLFIVAGVQNASMKKLLKEGDYTLEGKRKSAIKDRVGSIYWGIIVAIYLILSFTTEAWKNTWLVFAVGGVLFPVLMAVCDTLINKNKNE